MKLRDFPRWAVGLLIATTILLIGNLLLFISQARPILSAWSWKIDSGLATLIGAIIGLGIVAWQARIGFANLIRSQENQARLDREARLHQQELLERNRSAIEARETRVLMAALRAELASLHFQADSAAGVSSKMAQIYERMAKQGVQNSLKAIQFPSFHAAIYEAHISQLGSLGASLAADIVTVASMAKPVPPTQVEALSLGMLAAAYLTHAVAMTNWQQDLYHVAMRLRAAEEGSPDPGILSETRAKRASQLKDNTQPNNGAPELPLEC